ANALIALPTSLAFVLAVIASALLPLWPPAGEAMANVAGMVAQLVVEIVDRLGSDHLMRAMGGGGTASAWWITAWCVVAIALMSGEFRVAARTTGVGLMAANRTVAFAMAGVLGGILLGVLGWLLH
ncbi:MAG TPA: hypothetical protein VFL82_15660, partial [Thermomicrobiales bacterium]|nr:hypothetical protein [Thermomicrobiales bacterium]